MGFRGGKVILPKPKGEFRIACLGGSTTYGDGVTDWHKAYPAALETALRNRGYRVSVVNAGVPGFNSRDLLLKFETEVIPLDVDMIVYCEAINDLFGRSVWPPEIDRFHRAFRYNQCYSLFDQFAAYRVVRDVLKRDKDFGSLKLADGVKGYCLLLNALAQANLGTYPDGVFKTVSWRQVFDCELNSMAYFTENQRSVAAIATGRGIAPVFMSFVLCPGLMPTAASGKDVDAVFLTA